MQDFEQLKQALQQGVVHLVFVKQDGSQRHMQATLVESLLPVTDNQPVTRSKSEHSQAVWDTQLQAWRSFRKDRVVSWQAISASNGAAAT